MTHCCCHRLVQWHDVTYGKHSWELPRLAQALQAPATPFVRRVLWQGRGTREAAGALTRCCCRLVQWHDVSYGKHSWELPRLAQVLQASTEAKAAVFLTALLQGQVIPCLQGSSFKIR